MTTKQKTEYSCPRCGSTMWKWSKAQSGRQRWICSSQHNGGPYCYSTTDPEANCVHTRSGNAARVPRFVRDLRKAKRFLITAAQNATPAHEGFLSALEACAKDSERELVVIPLRYKNPTSRWTDSQRNSEYWTTAVQPYLYNQRRRLNANLVLLGDIKTRPTAETPLTGFEGISHGESAILAHTKLQLKTVATPQNRLPKILTTTGACTVPNYTDSKSGKKGDFHHVLGACAVDLDGKKFHLRQVNATKEGSFIDLTHEYTAEGKVRRAPAPASLTMGDTHVGESDPAVLEARLRLLKLVDPKEQTTLVHHDLCNGRSVNPHEFDMPFTQLAMHRAGVRNVRAEIEDAAAFVLAYGGKRPKVIVRSNHNDFIARWLDRHDWKKDPENSAFYLETAHAIAQSAHMGESGPEYDDAFTYWMRKLLAGQNVLLPGREDSVLLANVEHNYHGDKGPNGTRGSVLNMSKLGVKINIGHVHAPAILGPLFAAGTSTYLDPPYTRGHPGGWLNADVLTYGNGKRTLVVYIDGSFQA